MQKESLLKRLISKIKHILLIILLLIGKIIKSIFSSSKNNQSPNITKNKKTKLESKQVKKETPTTDITSIPDEDNMKTNKHNSINNTSDNEDITSNNEVILEIPKEKLYKVYTKNNELKYLSINALLDLFIKEALEEIYKVEKFKLKTATTKELIKVEEIKKNVLPEIITRVENETLRNSEVIKEELIIKLEEELEKNPLFPPRPKLNEKQNKPYTLAHPKKKEIFLPNLELPKIKTNHNTKITNEQKEVINTKLETTKTIMVQTTNEIPSPTIKDNLKETTTIASLATIGLIKEVLTPMKEKEEKEEKQEKEEKNRQEEQPKTESKDKPETITLPENNEKTQNKLSKDNNQVNKIEEKNDETKEEIIKLEETPPEIIIEEKKEELNEAIIISTTLIANEIIENSKEEIKKEDFFEKDYDKIEKQINKMLDDITNTYLKYEKNLTDKQKKKLKIEEERLRQTKKSIKEQKNKDIALEQRELDETIKESELNGLQQELQKIHLENQKEVSDNLLHKMKNLEDMTAEQVANADKRIMLSRFNKASILLEMTSLLALPFVRNKYFFYFTVGLVIDNHFNFINAFFNRKINRYEPADLSEIKKGQDALNGALDITYKNLVELDYLEQRALSKYPELAYDPRFINQVTRLRTNLNKKYNNLMRKNNIMEKYYMKTKRHRKILKQKQKNQEAA